MVTDKRLKVLIVDDHDIVRQGLAMLLARQEDLLVIGEAGTVAQAVKTAGELESELRSHPFLSKNEESEN